MHMIEIMSDLLWDCSKLELISYKSLVFFGGPLLLIALSIAYTHSHEPGIIVKQRLLGVVDMQPRLHAVM